jgi:hypothetical protein
MRHLKMLGLAVVAAAAFMAFIGASSASATVLCTETTTPCPAGKKIGPTGDSTDNWIHATLEPTTSAYLLATTGQGSETKEPLVTCNESTVTAESLNTGSATETARGEVTALSFGGCTHRVVVVKRGELEVHWIEGTHHGTVTSKGAEVTVEIIGVTCTYGSGAGTDIGILTGGSMATMDIHAVVNKVGGSLLCPSTAIWEANYTVTEPEPLYVLKE